MSMYLGRIHVRASLPVNYGLLYWAFISGLHVINKWKMCSEFQKKVFRTINSMRYVRYGALKDRTVQRLPKHCVCRSTTHLVNEQTKYTTNCTLKIAAAATRAGGATEAVSRPEEWRRSSLFQTKHQPSLQKGYQKRTSVCIKLNKDPTTPSVRI